MRCRRLSFPLKLLLMNANFFYVNAGIPPPLVSLGNTLSTQVLVKVKVAGIDAGRLDGRRAGGATALAAMSGPRPSWPLKVYSFLISADAGGVGYCMLTPALFTSGLRLGV